MPILAKIEDLTRRDIKFYVEQFNSSKVWKINNILEHGTNEETSKMSDILCLNSKKLSEDNLKNMKSYLERIILWGKNNKILKEPEE